MNAPGTPQRAALWRGAIARAALLFPLLWALAWGVMAVTP